MALSAKAIVEIIRLRTAQLTEARGGRQPIRQLAPSGARAPPSSRTRVRTLPSRPLQSSSLDRKDARQDARAEARCRHPSVRRPEVAGYRYGLSGLSR